MQRFLAEGKPGATSRSGAPYSTWFNGGLRTTAGFHNIIGILTETIGSPTPSQVPLVPAKQLPRGDYLAPIPPQRWHFRQSVDYSVTANRAVLDVASRHREQFLYNIYKMGKNSIERGSTDYWTVTPSDIEKRLSAQSLYTIYATLALSLGLGGLHSRHRVDFLSDPAVKASTPP